MIIDKNGFIHHVFFWLKNPESKEDLSHREKQILELLIEGKSSKEIGNVLYISKQTVDTHRKNMIHKKNLSNTSELVCKAIRQGWI